MTSKGSTEVSRELSTSSSSVPRRSTDRRSAASARASRSSAAGLRQLEEALDHLDCERARVVGDELGWRRPAQPPAVIARLEQVALEQLEADLRALIAEAVDEPDAEVEDRAGELDIAPGPRREHARGDRAEG